MIVRHSLETSGKAAVLYAADSSASNRAFTGHPTAAGPPELDHEHAIIKNVDLRSSPGEFSMRQARDFSSRQPFDAQPFPATSYSTGTFFI